MSRFRKLQYRTIGARSLCVTFLPASRPGLLTAASSRLVCK